jgi:hypothetical protein
VLHPLLPSCVYVPSAVRRARDQLIVSPGLNDAADAAMLSANRNVAAPTSSDGETR